MKTAPHFKTAIKTGLRCKCPKCGEGALYDSKWNIDVSPSCPVCHLDLSANDSADGPAFIMIFVLGVLLVPLALLLEKIAAPPLWIHAVVWTIIALGITLGTLRPLKAIVIALIYKADPERWESKP